VEQWERIRYRGLREGVAKSQILAETGMHWRILEKILTYSEPLGYSLKKPRERPKTAPCLDRIRQILKEAARLRRSSVTRPRGSSSACGITRAIRRRSRRRCGAFPC
jgi:hypothetical protein